ncbi:MAG: hypothetical protein Q8P90_06280 [bacterium]|nr:hypothetical protein [bacterium]
MNTKLVKKNKFIRKAKVAGLSLLLLFIPIASFASVSEISPTATVPVASPAPVASGAIEAGSSTAIAPVSAQDPADEGRVADAKAAVQGYMGKLITFGGDGILYAVTAILYFFMIYLNGETIFLLSKVLVYVANFSGFTNRPSVIDAWSVVRDLSNMFFIVILLFIAFGTLFRIEAYSWKKLLPKMVLAAVLVNFSRAICGVVVDASQVIMLTFVAAIQPAMDQGLVSAFQLGDLLTLRDFGGNVDANPTAGITDAAKARFLSVAVAGYMLQTLVTVLFVYVVVIAGRLAFIWFLTILSPLAFASMVLPATEKYFKQWWEMFGRYVAIGPMIMFFLWLSLFIAAKTGGALATEAAPDLDQALAESISGVSEALGPTTTKALSTETVVGFLIATMMLMAGLKLAQDNSSEMGGIVGKAAEWGKWTSRASLRYGLKPAGEMAVDRLYSNTGLDLNVSRQYGRMQNKRAEIKRKRELTGRAKAGAAAEKGNFVKAWMGAADYAYEQYTPVLGNQGLIGGGRRSMLGRMAGNQMFNRAQTTMGNADKRLTGANSALTTERGKYKDVIGNDERLREQGRAKSDRDGIDALLAGGGPYTFDMTEGSSERGYLNEMKSGMVSERRKAYAGGDTAKGQELDNKIQHLDTALAQTGSNVTLDSAIEGDVTGALTAKRQQAHERYNKYSNEDLSKVGGKTAADSASVQELVNAAVATQQSAVDAAGIDVKNAAQEARKWGPVIDYEKTSMQQALLAEANKNFAGESNEDVLKDLLVSKFQEGDGIDALGIITHAASVGHLNEMMDAMGLEMSIDGMKQLEQKLEGLGVTRDMAMSAMNQASNSAKGINHWAFAEAVTQKNGRYEWRDDEEREHRKFVEATKAGANNVFRNGNRLALGGYKGVGENAKWQPDAAMLGLLAQSMPRLKDTATKGMLNDNGGAHLFGGAPGDSSGRIEAKLNELIEVQHAGDARSLKDAHDTMNLWKQSSKRAEGGGQAGPYDIAKRVMAEPS